MTLPRGRIFTLSHYQPRPTLPVSVHRGDQVDVTINWVRLLRTRETPNEVITAANVAGSRVTITNVEFSGKYLSFAISGAQGTGEARISMAISTSNGRTLSRSLKVRTVYEDAVIDPVVPDPEPEPSEYVTTGVISSSYTYGGGIYSDAYQQTLTDLQWQPEQEDDTVDLLMEYGGQLGAALVYMVYDAADEMTQSSLISIAFEFSETPAAGADYTGDDAIEYGSGPYDGWKYWAFEMPVSADALVDEAFTVTAVVELPE